MAEQNISQAVTTDLTNTMTDYSVPSEDTDGAGGNGDTEYQTSTWTQNFGYYSVPEVRAVIDAKATWTVGKGFEADEMTTLLLGTIKGMGKDTFNTILENAIRTYQINGDAFIEIVRDKKEDLVNLRPLNPATMKIVVNKSGRVIRYEQTAKVKGANKKFKPDEILHLMRNRVADQIHGTSMIDALIPIILMKNEAMTDWKRVLHRNIDPLWIIHADTDDTTKIAKIKTDWEAIKKEGETWVVPKDVIVPELISVASNASLSPLPWIDMLDNKFYEAAGVPKIILGGSGEFTEASAKIAYLAFQQNIEEEQLYIEEQIEQQLNQIIKLTFPASLENELLSDNKKDGDESTQPNETTAGSGQ